MRSASAMGRLSRAEEPALASKTARADRTPLPASRDHGEVNDRGERREGAASRLTRAYRIVVYRNTWTLNNQLRSRDSDCDGVPGPAGARAAAPPYIRRHDRSSLHPR